MHPTPKHPHPETNTNTHHQFAIITPRLILLPTPIAVSIPSYRTLYAELHADKSFCEMGFGDHFPVRTWSDCETRHVIESRDIEASWLRRGLGDFAVGLRLSAGAGGAGGVDGTIPDVGESTKSKSTLEAGSGGAVVVDGADFDHLSTPVPQSLDNITWVGYAGIRDATTTSLSFRDPANIALLPPWDEMVEVRYGISPRFWGAGFAREAAGAVMQWAVSKRDVKRFIAETEIGNQRSARVLSKLGFVPSHTDYFQEPSEVEWEWILR